MATSLEARNRSTLGRLSIGRQLQILGGILIVLLGAIAAIVVYDARQGTFGTIYIASVGRLQTLSQRLAKAAVQASQGNADAFKQLRSSRDEFAAVVKLLAFGGESGGTCSRCSTRSIGSGARPRRTRRW